MDFNNYKLEPAFDFNVAESSIQLTRGRAEICIDGNVYSGDGGVVLEFTPHGRLYFHGSFKDVPSIESLKLITEKNTISKFSINDREIPGFVINCKIGAMSDELIVKWSPRRRSIIGVGDSLSQISWVIFHVFNFVEYLGMRRSVELNHETKARIAIEHIDLDSHQWAIELKSLLVTSENIKVLKGEGGCRITHVGRFQKKNNNAFSGQDAYDCLRALGYFLSFAKGCWCEPVCAVGFNKNSERVWELWSSPREIWQSPPSWFDPHNTTQLASLFPGFMSRWVDEDWRKTLEEVIYWYLNANNSFRGIDAGIILSQTAIERLSYEFAVKDKKLLSSNGFKDLRASDKFRLLFSSIGLPTALPSETPEIANLPIKNQTNIYDAPYALVEIRNSLVHPEHKWKDVLTKAYYEAWNLSLWYLEMCILASCGYTETFGNRLKSHWIGEIEDVPWKN